VARIDPELELYRGLMDVPDKFEEGFDIKAVIGAIFVGFVMMPGAIYLGLVAGQSLGPAAEWTTIILFTEVARRSFITLKRQEIYILFYIASSLASSGGGLQLAGGAFAGKIWDQYFIQSPAAEGMGIASEVPHWVVPAANSEAILKRTFFHPDWMLPVAILMLGTLLSRMNWFGLGYALFRVTSDYEQLPFPFAAITAQGSTALAEATTKEESWRWRTFSIGAMIGLVFGALYIGVPTITGALMTKPLQLLPIPWIDLTRSTASILPAVPTGLMTDLGTVGAGFVVPFWAVVGGFISAIGTMILNPYLYRTGVLTRWKPEMGTIETQFNNQVDFYFSLGIGVSLAVAVIGIASIIWQVIVDRRHRSRNEKVERTWAAPPNRGDIPMWIAIGMFVVSTIGYVILCWALVPKFPLLFVILFGFVLTPLNSYIDARMIGLTGQWVGIPMVKEAAIIFSKYRGVDIWFAPIPNFDHGGQAMKFRVLELTGTRITGLIKAELLIWPITIFCSLLFWQFIWRLAPIPSVYYPYAQKMWHLAALQRGLWMTSTLRPENSLFFKAWNMDRALVGFAFGIISYVVLARLRLPIMLIYGIVRGLGTLPHAIFPEMVGALISEFYFVPRFGARRWKQYATVLMAGYACGMGLVGMGTVAIAMVSKSVSQMPY
jgi:hypothetical protein